MTGKVPENEDDKTVILRRHKPEPTKPVEADGQAKQASADFLMPMMQPQENAPGVYIPFQARANPVTKPGRAIAGKPVVHLHGLPAATIKN